jgi:hypothetical protein
VKREYLAPRNFCDSIQDCLSATTAEPTDCAKMERLIAFQVQDAQSEMRQRPSSLRLVPQEFDFMRLPRESRTYCPGKCFVN